MDIRTNILFLGYPITKNEASNLYGASVAGNKMQINVLENLSKCPDLNIKCITIYPTAAYPKGKLFIKRQSINLFNEFYSLKIGFINIPILKQFFETINTYIEAKKIIKKDNIKIIFTFNMFPQIGVPAKWLKKKFGCKIMTLLADLPIDTIVGGNQFYLFLRKYFDDLTKVAITSCDRIITLNKNAVDLYAPEIDYIVVEGGVDLEDIIDIPEKIVTRKNIVYSGSLVEYSGIINLIKAMNNVSDKEVFLEIYGDGQLKEYVAQCAAENQKVKYRGKVDNCTMKKIQMDAYLLINPRPIDDPISKVTFPSKIFEYLISGTPVLSTKLNGFTEEYMDIMFFIDNNDPFMMADKINEIMSLPYIELREKALKARQFVIENKTWEKQCQKINNFIKEAK